MTHPEALVEKIAQALHTARVGDSDNICDPDYPSPDGTCWDHARAVLDLFEVREDFGDSYWLTDSKIDVREVFDDPTRFDPDYLPVRRYVLTTPWEDAS